MPFSLTIPVNIDGVDQIMNLTSEAYLAERTIYLTGPINEENAADICRQLRYLDKRCHDPITMMIFSPGGEVSSGKAIIDAMNSVRSIVKTVVWGMAASMAAVILAAGAPGERYATDNADIMIHQPIGGANGQATDILIAAEHIQREKKKLAEMLAGYCGQNIETVLRDIERDCWMEPENALEYGLIDKIGFPQNKEE